MSITYKFEFGNSEIENFSDFVEKTFKTVLECGQPLSLTYLFFDDIMKKNT